MNDNNNPERIEPVQSPGPDAPVTPPLAAASAVADKAPALADGWERATLEKLAFAALEEQKSTRRW
ncbi:MAG: S49 family peptidase, partial [Polaromonas sp.]|nr:S49 family peptidase [Polaromonas sp.]